MPTCINHIFVKSGVCTWTYKLKCVSTFYVHSIGPFCFPDTNSWDGLLSQHYSDHAFKLPPTIC